MSEKYLARVPFTYVQRKLDRGELCDLKGSARDAQLLGLKYFVVFDPAVHTRILCPDCGRAFASESFLLSHKRKEGGCMAATQEITREETAVLLDMDPDKVKVEE